MDNANPKLISLDSSPDEEGMLINKKNLDYRNDTHPITTSGEQYYKYKEVWKRAVKKITIKNWLSAMNTNRSFRSDIQSRLTENLSIEMPISSRCLLKPNNKFRSSWDIYIGFILLYIAFVSTFILAFENPTYWDAWVVIDLVIDCSFLLDVIFNLNTSYYDKDNLLVHNRKKIFCNYLKGWLVFDLIASMPIGLIEYAIDDSDPEESYDYSNFLRLFRMRSLARFFKLSKISKVFKHYGSNSVIQELQDLFRVGHGGFRIMKMTFGAVFCLHIVACSWWAIARAQGFTNTWVDTNNFQDISTSSQYIVSLYWAVTTLTTVGYGDISPQTDAERLLAILWMIVGIYIVTYVISMLTNIMSELDSNKLMVEEKIKLIDSFAQDKNLSKKVSKKIQNFVRNSRGSVYTMEEEIGLIKSLPSELKLEIARSVYKGRVLKMPFFDDCDDRLLYTIIPFIKQRSYLVDEYIYVKGDYARNIFFVHSGAVYYVFGDKGLMFDSVTRNGMFGEYEIIKNIGRKYTTTAGLTCSLFVMNDSVIGELQQLFPRKFSQLEAESDEKEEGIAKNLVKMKLSLQANKEGLLETLTKSDIQAMVDKKLKKMKIKDMMNNPLTTEEYFDNLNSLKQMIEAINTKITHLENKLCKN